jgi:hypothetical protein
MSTFGDACVAAGAAGADARFMPFALPSGPCKDICKLEIVLDSTTVFTPGSARYDACRTEVLLFHF